MKFHKTTLDGNPTRDLELGRGTIRDLVGPAIGASNVDVHVNAIDVGAGRGEIHYHAKAENVYIVLDGLLEVCIEGGERHVLEPGEIGFIPAGIVHTAANAGDDGPVRIIEIYAPAGPDFHEVDGWPGGVEPPEGRGPEPE